jgi:hypothetical protein
LSERRVSTQIQILRTLSDRFKHCIDLFFEQEVGFEDCSGQRINFRNSFVNVSDELLDLFF